MPPTIYVDWNNINPEGKVRFTNGSFADIERLNIKLAPGIEVLFDDGEGLAVQGVIEYSHTENDWVGTFDRDKLDAIFPNK